MFVLLLALASAADLEVAAEFGVLPTTGSAQNRFGQADVLPVVGGRVGVALTDALTVQLAAHHGRRGATWFNEGQPIGAASFHATDLALGLEAVGPVNEYFAIGGMASATGLIGLARFNDDPNRDSPVQLKSTGLTGGFRTAAAVRITVPTGLPLPLQLRASLGYQWFAPMQLGDFGSTQMHGASFRTSVGVQF